MIPINKTLRPFIFDEWKSRHAQDIRTWIADTNLTAGDIWAKLSDAAKRDLQATLLRQQGYVCCYCGSRIETDTIEIEHLLPKNIFKDQTFEYDNLFACCFGGARDVKHRVKEGETLDSIAKFYDCPIENILVYAYDHNLNKQVPRPINGSINVGNELFIFPAKEQKHCGNGKGNKELTFDLKDKDLHLHFDYDKDGQVTSNKVNIKNGIDNVLFLNEESLVTWRKKEAMAHSEWFKAITKGKLSKQQIVETLQKKQEAYLKKYDGKYQPFYFVILNLIDKSQLLKKTLL